MCINRQRHATVRQSLDRLVHDTLQLAQTEIRPALERIIHQARVRSSLLSPARASTRIGSRENRLLLMALFNLAVHQDGWVRPVEAWTPPRAGQWLEFVSLVEHLFARHHVPRVLLSGWFTDQGRRAQNWYRHMGLGRNIRTADLPLCFTRTMARKFGHAPQHLAIPHALRWAQVQGLGGSHAFTQAILNTRLAVKFEHDDFWRSAIEILMKVDGLNLAHVGPLVEYVHQQKFVPRCKFEAAPFREAAPLDPDFSFKGRSIKGLIRDVLAWRKLQEDETRRPNPRWTRCSIGEFERIDIGPDGQTARIWTIRELLSLRSLKIEGNAMRHCVKSYVKDCLSGEATIWSLRIEDMRGQRRVVTIDVDPRTKTIHQVKRLSNEYPHPKDREIVECWARQEGLTIGPFALGHGNSEA